MQAAQIDPAKVYAIYVRDPGRDQDHYLARFRVDYVKSFMSRRQLKPTAADYSHQVYGTIDERDVPPQRLPAEPDARAKYLTRILEPHQIEDEYGRFLELKERAVAEQKAADDDRAARVKMGKDLVTALYQLTGLKPELNPVSWKSLAAFECNDYNAEVRIKEEGTKALLAALQAEAAAK
jgi:hypothetical protein